MTVTLRAATQVSVLARIRLEVAAEQKDLVE